MHPKHTLNNTSCLQCGTRFRVTPSKADRKYCSQACYAEAQRGEEGMTPLNVARFWSRVDTSGGLDSCWPYDGMTDQHGYRYFSICQKKHRAHRIAAELFYGPCPDDRRVCHHCDNPSCCNPRHLYYGTAADNTRDMIERGRAKFFDLRTLGGEHHPNAILTEQVVLDLRKRWAREPFIVAEEARRMGVRPQTLWAVIKQVNWRHLPSVEELREEIHRSASHTN